MTIGLHKTTRFFLRIKKYFDQYFGSLKTLPNLNLKPEEKTILEAFNC
ncbi:MAG: hypothetical protein MPEBLZ_01615 [Candidatus Methanoperedens nitroreducens]|uniref:Uncharacterized protein n=1 Tax=Candidatus Methanoperedens nitratireducens TaxID=1392998 RepID=A0A0N8KR35_9EURY|nr:MAG: hypothetical protein MPEBLZ_01615 [Candidatus Methanoperedens sp. BLZ1]